MVKSLLIYLDEAHTAPGLIEFGVSLAAARHARVRGLTLRDMRRFHSAATSESAIRCCREYQRLNEAEEWQSEARDRLTAACSAADVDFEVRSAQGDPFEILPREAQFHDLTVTSVPSPQPRAAQTLRREATLSASEVLNLLARGVQPMLVLRTPALPIRRVLLVSDGTAASQSAVREFLRSELFPQAEMRLFAIGRTNEQARELLRELSEYTRQRGRKVERGYLCGNARTTILPYATKWQADLVVTGHRQQSALLNWWPQPAEQILRKSSMAVFVCGG